MGKRSLKTGKALTERRVEASKNKVVVCITQYWNYQVRIQFKNFACNNFSGDTVSNELVIRVQPDMGLHMKVILIAEVKTLYTYFTDDDQNFF